jgi:hypothetical protein
MGGGVRFFLGDFIFRCVPFSTWVWGCFRLLFRVIIVVGGEPRYVRNSAI